MIYCTYKSIQYIIYFLILLSSSVFTQNNTNVINILKYESDDTCQYIRYSGFVVVYDYENKIPKYTTHVITPEQISDKGVNKAKRRNNFYVDDVRIGSYSATNRDYYKSGFDRGHLVPAGDFYSNSILKDETFVLTNIAPQNPTLNRGIWYNLEHSIRNKVILFKDTAYVVTGTISINKTQKTIGTGNISVPNYFYKLVYLPHMNKMFAFLFDNNITSYEGTLTDYQVRVDDIEKITKQDYYDKLPDNLEDSLESLIIYIDE